MRSTLHFRKARRRGQALLLAVLIMIFAALLSAAFIGIVAVNLNQTARQTDKNRSLEAANTGMDYITRQLVSSADGDRWRSELESVPPAPGDASYAFYYTPMEMAQGWARTTPHPTTDLNGNGKFYDGSNPNTIDPGDERMALEATRLTGKLELVKFPDPRNQPDAPTQFLSQVERVPYTSTSDIAGTLKVTVIGLSSEDPTAYSRLVSYKGGYKHAPIAQVMRTVSSWDFVRNSSVAAQTNTTGGNDGTAATNPVLGVKNAKGDFTKLGVPFPITISNPKSSSSTTQAAVVVSVSQPNINDNTAYTLALAKPLSTTPSSDELVNLAADFGGPTGVNLDNNPNNLASPTLTPFSTPIALSDTTLTPSVNQVDGARVNGSLIWSGALVAARLRPITSAYGSTGFVPGTIWASAVIAPDPNSPLASTATVRDITSSNSDTLKVSDDTGIFSTSLQLNQNELVQDGWNANKGVPAGNTAGRTVREFTPPAIDSGASLERYRDLTRFSTPLTSGDPASVSLYGFGQGIYIDNKQDIEKKTGTTNPIPMTQSDLVKMWLSPAASTEVYARQNTPSAANSLTASLEEQHLRGWVGPDEFHARGVEIELGDNSLTITRDSRDDNNGVASSAFGPVLEKAWKDKNGNALQGVYTRVFPWPTNGTIFAEGNIRIKGQAINAPRSLTIVSMGNIYIEDSLSADADADGLLTTGTPRKILLMAKRNVVMNPTRLLGRPDQQTTLATNQTLSIGNATLTVANAFGFHKGDLIQVGSATLPAQGIITAEPTTDTSIDAYFFSGGAAVAGSLVFTPNASTQTIASTTGTPRNFLTNNISTVSDVIQRRIYVPTNSNLANVRIAFNHEGSRVPGLTIEAVSSGGTYNLPTTSGIYFSNKGVFLTPAATSAPYLDHTKTVTALADRKLVGQYTEPSPAGQDEFFGTPATTPVDENDAQARDLTNLAAQMGSVQHNETDPMGIGWTYKATPATGYENLPFFYLAGVGNRTTNGVTSTVPTERRPQINTAFTGGAAYEVPLATSINLQLNASPTSLYNQNWNTTLATPNYDGAIQFGFKATYLDYPGSPNDDILTGDESFYQANPAQSTLDSRSAYNTAAGTSTLALGRNTLVLRHAAGLIYPTGATAKLPDYRLMDMKLENVTQTVTAGVSAITGITPGHAFDVNAYVYAQTGSWFVIPGPVYDDRLRGDETQSYLDIDNDNTADPGEYLDVNSSGTYDAGDFADLDRNGVIDTYEKYAVARFSRFNYSITFTGAIAENQTPLINDVGTTAIGAVSDWMSKWTTTSFDGTNITHDRIKYIFDPTVVSGKLEDDLTTPNVDETDYGFRLPQTSDIFNVS